jgi:hypothetical protein
MEEIGPYILMTDKEGDFELGIQAAMKKLIALHGIPINSLTESSIKKLAKEESTKIVKKTKRGGIPSHLRILLSLKRKKEVLRYIKNIVMTNHDLPNLILTCKCLGFTHQSKHIQFVPEDLFLTDDERAGFSKKNISEDGANKVDKKISEIFKNRKYLSVHLFERGDEWHIFYFDYHDAYTPRNLNHSELGPHIHYISYLWGKGFNKDDLLAAFEFRKVVINSEHIRYVEKEAPIDHTKQTIKRVNPRDLYYESQQLDLRVGKSKKIASQSNRVLLHKSSIMKT